MNEISYETYLERYGSLTYRTVGTSMLPMLKQDRDLFTVRKKGAERCRRYDVVLYRRPPGHYVLHRIVEVRDKDYVLLGDNCIRREYGIREEDILGVLTGFVRNGTSRSVTDLGYRLYVRLWCGLYPLRAVLMRAAAVLRRIRKKQKQ